MTTTETQRSAAPRRGGSKPQVLCWVGRGHEPSYFFAAADLARLEEVASVRFILTRGQTYAEEAVVRESAGVEGAITTWDSVVYSDAILERCPDLHMLARFGGSVRGLIGPRAWAQGIRVVTAVEAMGRMIAELTVSMMFSGLYRLLRHYELQKSGAPLTMEAGVGLGQRSLYGKTVGLVGFGTIGRHVARMVAPFGCRVLAYDPHVAEEEFRARQVTRIGDLEELARQADILSLHAPHIPATTGMVSRRVLDQLKPGAVLVNTAWAELVDMAALEERVRAGSLVACLDNVDVMYGEGQKGIQRLRNSPDCLLTTIIGMHDDCIHLMGRQIVEEFLRFFRGEALQHEVRREMLDVRG